jgi:NAD(P)-dependent dehydrogenase (short-subunit alcohol dehydrogenase family)
MASVGLEVKAGLRALVTAGASGIGRAIAETLQAAGVRVHVCDVSEKALAQCRAALPSVSGSLTDVADEGQVDRLFADVKRELGGLDILINNAGLALRKRFVETTPEDWRAQIDACLYGAIHCCHAAAPHLNKSGSGRIVSIIGDSSRIGESGLAIVAAARAGVIALMKSLAREFGRSGTTANTVSLGLVETDHDKAWVEANREKLVGLYPLRRLGLASDVGPMVAMLASPRSAWITGQVLSISGGYSMV